MDQVYILPRWADAALFDPIERISSWPVNACDTQHDGATVLSQEFFSLHAQLGQIDRG